MFAGEGRRFQIKEVVDGNKKSKYEYVEGEEGKVGKVTKK